MNKIFFTADTHFGHSKIIGYCKRPFKDVEEMDNEIIKRWNSVITNNDTIYHLGDFAFGNRFDKYFDRLNGKIILISGNHDRLAIKNKEKFFDFYDTIHEIRIKGKLFVLCHYAMRVWNKSYHGSYHIYGHSHGTLTHSQGSSSFDCGVDTNNFYPYSYRDAVRKILKNGKYRH